MHIIKNVDTGGSLLLCRFKPYFSATLMGLIIYRAIIPSAMTLCVKLWKSETSSSFIKAVLQQCSILKSCRCCVQLAFSRINKNWSPNLLNCITNE